MLVPANSILFISDLHLSERTPALTALFLAFLRGPASKAEALYILGDLFDVWVGEDLTSSFHDELVEALNILSAKRIPIYFMPGNRDFLVSSHYLKKSKMIALSDRVVIDLHGTPTLLMHGDLLCTQDIAYQRYRKVAQHPFTRALFLRLPRRMRQAIANSLRQNSKRYQKNQPTNILDVTHETVIHEMGNAKVISMIHGHVHRPAIHHLDINHHPANRVVLGDWNEGLGSVVIASPKEIALATFTADQTLIVKSCLTFF